jgi:multidrug efflux pump subunit AcrB
MSLAKFAVEKKALTGFTTAILVIAGLLSFFQLGQLEDPEFTVKTAVITTSYPGASAEEVELEVTDRIELALQELPQIKYLESISRPGLSLISAEILPKYTSEQLPQVWQELRSKVDDVTASLPPGCGTPDVADDFGDVYGFLLAITGNGFTYAQMEDYADTIKKELSLVPGVSRVELWGVQTQCVYIDIQESQLVLLGLSLETIENTLAQQNLVVDSGGVDLPVKRLRIEQTGEFRSPKDIENLVIRGGRMQQLGAGGTAESTGTDTGQLVRIGDIGTVRRGYVEPPIWEMRYNGKPALGMSISNTSGANVADLGKALDKRLAELTADLPVGIETHKVSWQSDLVSESIVAFMVSLSQAVVIVLVVLWVAMGFRTAMIVGFCGLVFVILVSFFVMFLWGIDLQRMSLGALVIAMGMMVDNAIVVVDGIVVRMQKGMSRKAAAVEAATVPAWPLLAATVIAVMAFYPIYASDEAAGEYCMSLFQVVAVSLILSWLLSVTITPLMCIWVLPEPKGVTSEAEMYQGGFYRVFRAVLAKAIGLRWGVIGLLVALLAVAFYGFGFLDRTFFPESARLQLMIDYWAPEGTRIQKVSKDLRSLEDHLLGDEQKRVTSVSAFLGQGPPRFYLPVDPEIPYQSYAQLIVNFDSYDSVNSLIPEIDTWMDENLPQAITVIRRYGMGPSETWKVEARISGPAIADSDVIRTLGQQGVDIIDTSTAAKVARVNWRQRVPKVVADYNQERARWSLVSRDNIARATQRAYDGYVVGQFRERDKLLPILLRNPQKERQQFADSMDTLQIHPSMSADSVPLSQVTTGIDVEWENPIIWRRDRRRTITVEANPPDGVPASVLRDDVLSQIEQMELPSGYSMEWGGEYESSRDAQMSLIPGIIPALIIAAIAIVALFNAFRPPLIIVCVIPFAMIGVTVGLLVTGQPFGFLALLGAMSLAGMMTKNAIVLLDQINIEKAAGKDDYQAVMDSAVSRLRPVVLAAATTVLGVMPLLPDVFWVAMAVTIMFGLAFGTVLTMILLPVLYACFYRAQPANEK